MQDPTTVKKVLFSDFIQRRPTTNPAIAKANLSRVLSVVSSKVGNIPTIPQNFVFVGGSYTLIDRETMQNNFNASLINSFVEVEDLIFNTAEDYILYILARSRTIFSSTYYLTRTILTSSFINLLSVAGETLDFTTLKVDKKLRRLGNKIAHLINEILEHLAIEGVWVVTDFSLSIIKNCIRLAKLVRSFWKTILRGSVVAVVALCFFSLSTVSVSAQVNSGDVLKISNSEKESVNNQNGLILGNINFVSNDIYYKPILVPVKQTLKSGVITANQKIENNLLKDPIAVNSQSQYIVRDGENLDILIKRWNVSKTLLAASNLDFDFSTTTLKTGDKINKPFKTAFWINPTRVTTLAQISQILNYPLDELSAIAENKDQIVYNSKSSILIAEENPKAILKYLEILHANNLTYPLDNFKNTLYQIKLENERLEAEKSRILLEKTNLERAEKEKKDALELAAKNAQIAIVSNQPVEQSIQGQSVINVVGNLVITPLPPAPAPTSGSKMVWPTIGRLERCAISGHLACDISGPAGTNVIAFRGGKVVEAGWKNGGYGNMVKIDHGNGLESIYMHLSAVSVSVGQFVNAGDNIGAMGSTGNSTGSHLHFGLFQGGTEISPFTYLRWGG